MQVQVSETARQDRDQVLRFLQAPSDAADLFIRDIALGVRHLEKFPDTAVRRRDLTSYDVHFWYVAPYFLVVTRAPELTNLIAILHSSQNIRRELRKRLGKKPS